MTLKRLLSAMTVLLLALCTFTASAQDKVVTGKVTDSKDGSPVVGASVVPKGSATGGTTTGTDGAYSLSVGPNVTMIIVSFVGYGTQEISIVGKTAVDVGLASSGSNLNEVVVVGYGTARKRDLTGAVASVKAKDFNQGVITAPDQLIQGKVAGVQVINNTGAPGGATTVRIRGISSIRSGNSPLFVIDGVPLSGGAAPGLGSPLGGAPGQNPLNFINPADIASMDVLKDASATAIYGSRGANGVVIITTKKGQSGVPKIEFNASVGVSSLLKRLDVLDAGEFKAASAKYNLTGGDFGADVDALEEILQNGLVQNYNVGITGGNESGRYRISLGVMDQEGIVKESGFTKYNASISGNYRFLESKKLGFDFSLITTSTSTKSAPISNDAGFQGSLIGNALQWNPTHVLDWSPAKPIDTLGLGASTMNPLALLGAYDDVANVTSILASISPSFKITDELEYRFMYSIFHEQGERRAELRRWLNLQGNRGFGQIVNIRSINQQLTHTLSYNKNLTENLYMTALIGYEYLRNDFRGSGMTGNNFVDYPGLKYTDYMQNVPPNDRSMFSFANPISELQSYFARATFNYNDKYLLTATFRADGSSKFGANNKYGYFPSFAAAWNISNEDFLSSNSFVNNLKLRLGWGQTGNQEFPSAASLRVVGIGQEQNQNVANLNNEDIKWETNTLANIGIDFGLMGDRIFGSIDYYNRKTEDALFQQVVTQPGPPIRFWTNIPGTITNSGLEIALNGGIIKNREVNWNAGFNIAFQKNELQDFVGAIETGGLHGQGISGATSQRLVSGQPINVYYLRNFEGLDKSTGQSIYTDDGNTLFYSGSPNPKTVYGFSTDVSYKKWALVLNFNGASGHLLYNNTNNSVLPIGNLIAKRNIAASLLDTDVEENLSNALAPSTRYLEKGDYLKLANATLSYRLGNFAKVIKGANIYLTGQNLFVITKFTGFDPEVNVDKNVNGVPSLGIEYIPYPTARTIIFGINFSL